MPAFNASKILLIGATSGLGEAFCRNFHSSLPNTQIIIAGRRKAELERVASSLNAEGSARVHTLQWDISDLEAIPKTCQSLVAQHPDIDAVFLNAGIQKSYSVMKAPSSDDIVTDKDIVDEITINYTSQVLLVRYLLPHLLSIAGSKKPATLFLTSSGLAYVPMAQYPSYCPAKAAIHSLCIILRQQISEDPNEEVKRNVNICEIAPPWVDTGLDAEHRSRLAQKAKEAGVEMKVKPMPLDEYISKSMEQIMDKTGLKKEIGVGFSQMGIDAWRGSIGKAMEEFGMAS